MRPLISLALLCLSAVPLSAQSSAILLLKSSGSSGPVVYEARTGTPGTGTFNTSVSASITLGGASSTRAVMVALSFNINTVSTITVTVGGQSASLVSGTDSGTTYSGARTALYCLATTLTGAQTVAASWTTSSGVSVGAISATGVNQTTPCNNGTFAGSGSITVTSNSGDLTSTSIASTSGAATSNQTQKWTAAAYSGVNAAGDVGAGTGTTTHVWTGGVSTISLSGANFVQ